MKFRCERDVLADAVGSAGRAATNRTGTLPVLAGVRMEISGDTLTVTGIDLELTIRSYVLHILPLLLLFLSGLAPSFSPSLSIRTKMTLNLSGWILLREEKN